MAKESYGQRGQQRGVPKAQQARNNPKPNDPNGPQSPGVPVPGTTPAANYLTPEQQAKVDKFLGDKYDPSKPLNVQLFKAQWQTMSQEQRRAYAQSKAGEFIQGGPSSKTLSGFHSDYLDALQEQNRELQRTYEDRLNTYSQEGGGFAQSQAEFDANTAYWNTFAGTPEGQQFIAGQGFTPEEWIANQQASMQEGLDNYTQQVNQFGKIQNLAQRIGIEAPGFVPPGWASTLESIQAGTAPLPGMTTLHNYSGVAATVEGISPDLYQRQSRKVQQDAGGGAVDTSGGLYQPFTAFTGVQQPNSFSERDLYQETQAR